MRIRAYAFTAAVLLGVTACGNATSRSDADAAQPAAPAAATQEAGTNAAGATTAGPGGAVVTTNAGNPEKSAAADARTTSYVSVTATGGQYRLAVVSRTDGAVIREFAKLPAALGDSPFLDASLAPDGSVWAVIGEDSEAPYATKLVHYTSRGITATVPYVTNVRVAPDGTRVAVGVLSPDGDGNGQGSYSLRLLDTTGKALKTLTHQGFPVDAEGWPTLETPVPAPVAWLGGGTVVVKHGCCDSGSIAFVPTTGTTDLNRVKSFNGDAQTTVLGTYPNGDVLVSRTREIGDGSEKAPYDVVGFESYRISAKNLTGTRRGYEATKNGIDAVGERLLKDSGATPVWASTTRFPNDGPGLKIAAFL